MSKSLFWFSAIAVTFFTFSFDAAAQPGDGQGRQGGRQQGQMAFGQFGGGVGGMAASPNQLLNNEEVVAMLEITAEQRESLRPQRGQGAQRQGGQGQAGAGGQQMRTPAEQRARADEMWKNIGEVLKEEQMAKFKEIFFQAANGLNSPMLDARILGALDLTEEQAKTINEIADKRTEESGTVTRPGRDAASEELAAFRAATAERNEKYAAKIKAVLTDEQKKKAEELTAGAAELRTKLGIGQPRQGRQGGGARNVNN